MKVCLSYRCAYKLLNTFLFIKILPEQDTKITELYSSDLESSIDSTNLLTKRSAAMA